MKERNISYFKKTLVVLMAMIMVFTYMPGMAWAAGDDETPTSGTTTATVNFTAQAEGSFLVAPQFGVSVSSDLAESYGYTDQVADGVSALDVLVKAHELIFGEGFTKDTANTMLVVPSTGFISKIFGTETSSCGFMLNGAYPNDGTKSAYGGGYNGTTVINQKAVDGDMFDFFIYQDQSTWSDKMSWLEKDGKAISTLSVNKNEEISLTLKGFYHSSGYLWKDAAELHTKGSAVESAQLALVNPTNGEITDIAGKTTDENGAVTLSFKRAGEYLLTAYIPAAKNADDAKAIVMPVYKVTVLSKTITADWKNFRNSDYNNGITNVKTPVSQEGAALKWAKKLGSGWASAPSVQIIVDDSVVVMVGTSLHKLRLSDGEILATGTMSAAPSYGYTPPTYAEGMIFCPLGNGTVQAFDADTLESLWIYQDALKGQSLSPITYSDGKVYTGFWNAEAKEAAYVCISVSDDNPDTADDAKTAVWRDVKAGGFYWAGSVVVGDYIIYGSDNGVSDATSEGSRLVAKDKNTGTTKSELALTGDQRSTISYDNGKVYFTTKDGKLWRADFDESTGTLSNLISKAYSNIGTQSTSTPVVYKGVVYFGIGSGFNKPGYILAVDADTLDLIWNVEEPAYPQCSVLLSTAYENQGYLYLYTTYNGNPGGIDCIKIKKNAKSDADVEKITLYDAEGYSQYCICSVICDKNGNLYYKNDSGNVFCVTKNPIKSIKADASNARTKYYVGEKFDTTGLVVKGVHELGENESEIKNFSVDTQAFATAGNQKVTVSYQGENGALTTEIQVEVVDSVLESFTIETAPNKTTYNEGEKFDPTGMVVKAAFANGDFVENPAYTMEPGGNLTKNVKQIILSYKVGSVEKKAVLPIMVNAKESSGSNKINVSLRVIGATKSTSGNYDIGAGIKDSSYITWMKTDTYSVESGTNVGQLLSSATANAGIRLIGTANNYISDVYAPTVLGNYCLGEFTNGKYSGWMYTVNGSHPNVGVNDYTLKSGDSVIFHYINDYRYEVSDWFEDDGDYPNLGNSSTWDIWKYCPDVNPTKDTPTSGGGAAAPAEDVKDVTSDTKTGTTTAPTEVKVSEKTNADGTKSKVAEVKVSADNQKEILKQAKASKSKEIILNVSKSAVGDASKADVTLDKSFIDSILKDTDASLTVKTPFGDKTYTRDELKAMSQAATGSTVTIAVEKAAEEPTDNTAANIAKAKSITADMKLIARSSKTAKKNIKAVLKSDAKVKASVAELSDLGFTVKYRFYRSTKKAASYKSTVTKRVASYTNTAGKKNAKYFYKVQVRVYDENGKLVAKTALKQCKYAARTWSK